MPETKKNRNKKIREKLLKGLKFRASSFICMRVVSILQVMIFARLFAPEVLGVHVLAISFTSFFLGLANWGVKQNIICSDDVTEKFWNTAFIFSWGVGFVAAGLILVSPFFFETLIPKNTGVYIQFLSYTALLIPLRFPEIFFEKELEYGKPVIAQVIQALVTLLLTIAIELIFDLRVWSLLIGGALGFVLSTAYLWVASSNHPTFGFDYVAGKKIFNYGYPIMVQNINAQVYGQGHQFLIGANLASENVAFYSFAKQLPQLASMAMIYFETMLLPIYGKFKSDEDGTIKLFNLSNKIWSVIASFIGFYSLLFTDSIVMLLYGEGWERAVPVSRILIVSFIIRYCTGYAYDNIVLVRGRTRYMMKWGFINTILIFSVGYYFIKAYGLQGSAYYWLLHAIIMIPLVRFPVIYQEIGSLTFFYHVWQGVLAGLSAFVFVYLLAQSISMNYAVEMLVGAPVYCVIFFATLFVLDKDFLVTMKLFIMEKH